MSGTEKTENKNKKKIIFSAVLSLIAAVYIIYHIVASFSADTELYPVTLETFDDTEVFAGYIFRDDAPLLAGAVGTVDYFYSNGEKVAASSVIADVYQKADETVGARLTEIKREIGILEKSTVTGAESLEELDTQINQLRLEIARKTEDGELSWVSANSAELSVLQNKRALVSSGGTDYSAQIAILKSERASLLLSLGAKAASVTSESSGYFYSYCDGYEGRLTREKALDITCENFDEITSVTPVTYSNAVGAVVTDFRWYFVCKTNTASCEDFNTDTAYKCVFIGNSCSDEISMTLESKITDYESGEAVLRFSSSYIPPTFDMTRVQRVRVLRATNTGLSVPISAVRVIDGKTCVYIFKKGIARLREINILRERDGIYMVDGNTSGAYTAIAMNDLVIINEKNLYDGKIVG